LKHLKHLTGLGKKVAVLAVDPSSTISQQYFGDKTRMDELVKTKTHCRPSASGDTGWCS
jgi:LAO/AO transport system kinase